DLHPAAGAVHESAHRLQVDVPAPLGDIVGVADPVAELRPLPAYLANSCHIRNLLSFYETLSIPNNGWNPASPRSIALSRRGPRRAAFPGLRRRSDFNLLGNTGGLGNRFTKFM